MCKYIYNLTLIIYINIVDEQMRMIFVNIDEVRLLDEFKYIVYLEFPPSLHNDSIPQMIQLLDIKYQISEGVFMKF